LLNVIVYAADGAIAQEFVDEDAVDYVSLVSPETYGAPALVAPSRQPVARSDFGDVVLYINTSLVPLFSIERVED
jgi:hypothetical protein